MNRSKLGELLATFSKGEWRRFKDFVASPYFNKNEDVMQLCLAVAESEDLGQESKASVYGRAFPGQEYDASKMGHLMNYLLKLAEQFLAMERFQADDFRPKRYVLQELSERKLTKQYDFILRKVQKQLDDKPKNIEYFKQRYQLGEVKMIHFSNQKIRRFDPSMQEVYDGLNEYYYAALLKYVCAILSWKLVVTGEFELTSITKQVIKSLSAYPPKSPLIRIYLSIYKTISTGEEESDLHFQELERFLKEHRHSIEQEEMREIYLYAINYCARRMRDGEREYRKRVIELYEEAIEYRYIFEQGYLSHWTYTNVVKLILLEKRYDQAEAFIHRYKDHLPPRFYVDALHFNLAELNFKRGAYDEVLTHLQYLSYSDSYYNPGSRMLMIKTLYEKEELESLISHLASFTKFLMRHKGLSTTYQRTMLNFCKMLNQVLRVSAPDRKANLQEKIRKLPLLAEREWLLEALEREKVKG